ncbi:MAG TPA: hypothetical protein VFZ49_05105 [Pyrinomonadaceae bacterium]
MKFTWWGGVIGPKVLTHVKCPGCGHGYNGKTGRDNTTGIVIYSVIVGIVALALAVVVVAVAIMLIMVSR